MKIWARGNLKGRSSLAALAALLTRHLQCTPGSLKQTYVLPPAPIRHGLQPSLFYKGRPLFRVRPNKVFYLVWACPANHNWRPDPANVWTLQVLLIFRRKEQIMCSDQCDWETLKLWLDHAPPNIIENSWHLEGTVDIPHGWDAAPLCEQERPGHQTKDETFSHKIKMIATQAIKNNCSDYLAWFFSLKMRWRHLLQALIL